MSSFNYREQLELISGYLCTITRLYHDSAKRYGLSYNTMVVCYALNYGQPCTQKQISEEWGLAKQSVYNVVKDLHKKEYVVFWEGRNKKEKLVAFTSQGKNFVEKILEDNLALEERVLQRIGESGCLQLSENIGKFATIFEEELNAQTN